ncbi:glycan-binding surface protein [Maribellus sediminis]|uniref:glycan-binding surface protein n=1 Tax=Maribellus sediminis TaxID=2696285 RepID=UPI00143215ED|nr:glycan-binding surface protein [Maribellus sediminis]
MKNRINNYAYYWQLLFLAVVILFGSACQKEQMEPPVITGVINYEASPNDTAVTTIQTGQWVVLLGQNLSTVTQVNFGSVPATINTALFADGSLVVQLPDIPFESVPADELNIVTAISEGGMATFNINIIGDPQIARVRSSEAAPNDTVVDVLYPGDEINIVGYNLKDATEISFQGIAADLSEVVYTDTSAIVQVPADLSGSNPLLANTITYTTDVGSTNFSIRIVGPPVISYISLEVPHEGDMVYLYGYNFTAIQSLTFAGTAITNYEVSANESVLSFVSPALAQSGPVEITTQAGSFTTVYNVNEIALINSGGVGILANMEWGDYFGWGWGNGDVNLYSSDPNSGWPSYNTDYGVGYGMYLVYKSTPLEAGEDGYLDGWGGNQILINDGGGQWVPTENLGDSGDDWVIKFEMNVTKPWSGGTLCFRTASASNYIARYEPWKVSATKAIAVTTDGWQTISIPLSAFRLNDGEGDSISKVSDLLNADSGKTYMRVYLHNYRTSATENFEAAFDNFRVVRR